MTRLKDNKPGEPAGYQSAIFDYDGGNNKMKRTRPYRSSLDYKLAAAPGSNNNMYVIPPPSSSASGGGMGQASGRSQDQSTPRMVTTRARGSSGIPPPHQQGEWTLEDLQHLDEETMMRVLYENPHLAAEVERLQQENNNAAMDQMRRRTNDRSSARRKAVDSGSSYIDDLRKDGIPVVQWVMCLLLLGALVYQIYKTLQGPSTTGKAAKKAPKGSQKKKVKATASLDSELERLAAEVGPSVQTKKGTTGAAVVKKKPAKKKPTAKPKGATTVAAPATETNGMVRKKVQPLDRTLPASDGGEHSEQGSWHVVGSKPSSEKKKATPEADGTPDNGGSTVATTGTNDENSATTPAVETVKDKEPEHAPAPVAPESASEPKQPTTSNGTSGKKKKKKNKPRVTPDTSPAKVSTTAPVPTEADDAALAQALQQQENKLASVAATADENVWEEVVVKKRKPKA